MAPDDRRSLPSSLRWSSDSRRKPLHRQLGKWSKRECVKETLPVDQSARNWPRNSKAACRSCQEWWLVLLDRIGLLSEAQRSQADWLVEERSIERIMMWWSNTGIRRRSISQDHPSIRSEFGPGSTTRGKKCAVKNAPLSTQEGQRSMANNEVYRVV